MAPVWVTTLQASHYTKRHVACKCNNSLITYTIKKKDESEISLISIRKQVYCHHEPVNKRGSIMKSIIPSLPSVEYPGILFGGGVNKFS
jgi:hypothetical protein